MRARCGMANAEGTGRAVAADRTSGASKLGSVVPGRQAVSAGQAVHVWVKVSV